MDTFKKIRYIFNRKQKVTIVILACIIIGGAFCELLGITALLPFINVAISPNSIYENKYLLYFFNLFHMDNPNVFLAFMAGALILIYLLKNAYLTFMNYLMFRFTYNNQRQLAYRMLKTYLQQPYTFFLDHNSADLIRNVSDDTSVLFDTVLSVMQLMVELIVCTLLMIFLMMTDKSITIGVGVILTLFLLGFIKIMKKNVQQRGAKVRENRVGMSKWLLQAFGGIKETKILGKESFFLKKYNYEYSSFADNHCIYQTLSYLPKPLMETVCIGSVLLIVAIKLLRGVESEYFVSTISVFAVAAFRLLPAFNRITGYFSRIMFNKSSVNAVYHDLKQIEELEKLETMENKSKLPFVLEKEISVQDISFRYPNVNNYVLQNANLSIPKNKSIAFIGPSGAGKTTLADIILGVLTPENGYIKVDEISVFDNMKEWHKKLGYIPQTIYLLDDSIKHNIAYGVDENEIDEERLNNAIDEAQLRDFIDSLDNGIDMVIGERGVRLSGGQRQRLGIARALYTNPEVLILDEATSALDTETETAVMDAINGLAGKKTLIIIAHRLTTIKNCDYIYEIKDGKATLTRNV